MSGQVMSASREMCAEIIRYLRPAGGLEAAVEPATEDLWQSIAGAPLDRLNVLYEHAKVQRILLGEREQDALHEDPHTGTVALRLFVFSERRIVRRMMFTGRFWMRTQEWGTDSP
jgi:hypothetical protein